MICSASSDITKEPREAKGFVAYEIPSAIYISLLHPNTNSNLDTFTTMSGWSSRRGSCFSVLVISFLVVRSWIRWRYISYIKSVKKYPLFLQIQKYFSLKTKEIEGKKVGFEKKIYKFEKKKCKIMGMKKNHHKSWKKSGGIKEIRENTKWGKKSGVKIKKNGIQKRG